MRRSALPDDLPTGPVGTASTDGIHRVARPAGPLIADRGEFVDALGRLQRGHVLVRVTDVPGGCAIDGALLLHSFDTLLRFGLVAEYANARGFDGVRYFRITPAGRGFAERATARWRSLPWWQRALVRLTG